MTGIRDVSFGSPAKRWLGWSWLLVCTSVGLLTPVFAGESAREPVHYRIVVTGGELLSGAYSDGHTFFLTRTLRPLGLQCVGSMCVEDKQTDLKAALRFASDKAGLVIVTGGLGPTDNDITRKALSDFTGIPLHEHPDALSEMARRFNVSPAELRANLRRQTQTPARGTYLKNANGTAIGLVFETADCVIVALPGPPRELQPMVRDELVPYLSRRFGTRTLGCSLTLRFVGLGQSQIDQTLKDHALPPPGVITSSQFEGGRVDFTFSLPDDTPQARAMLRELKDNIVKCLGDSVYADDETTSLEEHILSLLAARNETLALAEVGSGGALAAALHGADAAQQIVAGAFVAPSEPRLQRLLGSPPGQPEDPTLARTARRLVDVTNCARAVVVGPILPDEAGTPFVQVAFRRPNGSLENHRLRLYGEGESARTRLVTEILDRLRHSLN